MMTLSVKARDDRGYFGRGVDRGRLGVAGMAVGCQRLILAR